MCIEYCYNSVCEMNTTVRVFVMSCYHDMYTVLMRLSYICIIIILVSLFTSSSILTHMCVLSTIVSTHYKNHESKYVSGPQTAFRLARVNFMTSKFAYLPHYTHTTRKVVYGPETKPKLPSIIKETEHTNCNYHNQH